jgi:hypothetical protein
MRPVDKTLSPLHPLEMGAVRHLFKVRSPVVYDPEPQDLRSHAVRQIDSLGSLIQGSLDHFGYAQDHPLRGGQSGGENPQLASEPITDAVAVVEHTDEQGEWVARWLIAERAGRLVIRGLTLEPVGPQTPGGGVTASMLRSLKPGEAIASASAVVNQPTTSIEDIASWSIRQARERRATDGPASPAERRKGRPRRSDEHMAAVAIAYLDEVGTSPSIYHQLAKRFHLEERTMKSQVKDARDLGWLGPAPGPGRKGGGPGPRLLEYLAGLERNNS